MQVEISKEHMLGSMIYKIVRIVSSFPCVCLCSWLRVLISCISLNPLLTLTILLIETFTVSIFSMKININVNINVKDHFYPCLRKNSLLLMAVWRELLNNCSQNLNFYTSPEWKKISVYCYLISYPLDNYLKIMFFMF